jgi:hypothetical protein
MASYIKLGGTMHYYKCRVPYRYEIYRVELIEI